MDPGRVTRVTPSGTRRSRPHTLLWPRGVAQLGSALALGARGRGFKSRHPDQHSRSAGARTGRPHAGRAKRAPTLDRAPFPPIKILTSRSTPVKSTVETLSPTRVKLAIEVPFAELEPSLRKAYREIGSQVNIPGFRAGKIPPAVIDQRIGRGA